MNRRHGLALGTVAAVGAVGFVLGRWSVAEPPALTVQRAAGAIEAQAAHTSLATAGAGHDHAEASLALSPPLASEVVERASPSAELDATLELARRLDSAPDDEHVEHAMNAAAGTLEARVLADPRALSAALERFAQVRSEAELSILAGVLGRVRDLEVEDLALQIARDDPSSERRVAALQILDAQDSPRATDLAVELLASDPNTAVRRAAVFAIAEPLGTSTHDAQRVIRGLSDAARSDADPELRRRAVVQLGAWNASPDDLALVTELLSSDPSLDVRAGCAFALEVAARRTPQVLAALTRSMNDRGEDLLVRENAWRALGRLGPLPDSVARDYAAFAEERERSIGG